MSVADAAVALDVTNAQIYHFKSGHRVPKMLELERLLRLFGVPELFEPLDTIRVDANERGWWSTYKLPAWLQTYVGLESDASVVRCWSLELMPGLLQTEDYAQATFERHHETAADIERHVEARMRRQGGVGMGQDITVVVSEALIHRTLHMKPFGLDQLRRLTEPVPGVTVRVLPFSAGGHRGLAGNFTLLDFPDGVISPVAYRHTPTGSEMTDERPEVTWLAEVFKDLQDHSLSRKESTAFITTLVRTVSASGDTRN